MSLPERWRFLVADLLTNAVQGELTPDGSVTFERLVNGAGSIQISVRLDDANILDGGSLIDITEPGKTAIYVERDGEIVFGGIIWTRRYNSSNRTMTLAGNEFWSYFSRRFVNYAGSWAGVDQLVIARSLIDVAQLDPAGNIGVVTGSETCGVLRDIEFKSNQLGRVADYINDLSLMEDGFDFIIQCSYVAGVITKSFKLGYPHWGVSKPEAVLEYPGNIVDFGIEEDAAAAWNVGYGVGDGITTGMINQNELNAGYPLLETAVTTKDISDIALLDNLVFRAIYEFGPTNQLTVASVFADETPPVGSYLEGDNIRIRIDDPYRFSGGLDTMKRVLGISFQAGGSGPDVVGLTLGNPV